MRGNDDTTKAASLSEISLNVEIKGVHMAWWSLHMILYSYEWQPPCSKDGDRPTDLPYDGPTTVQSVPATIKMNFYYIKDTMGHDTMAHELRPTAYDTAKNINGWRLAMTDDSDEDKGT